MVSLANRKFQLTLEKETLPNKIFRVKVSSGMYTKTSVTTLESLGFCPITS